MKNLIKNAKVVRGLNAVVDGTTTQSFEVDMAGFNTCTFLAVMGAVDGAMTCKVAQSDTSGSGQTDLAGSSIAVGASDDNKIGIVEVHKPTKRYLTFYIVRPAESAVIDAGIAILSNPSELPITDDSTTVGNEVHVSPAEGTA